MNKNFALATVVGAVVLFVLGYVIFELALGGFYESNAGTATGVMKESPEWLWFIIAVLAWSAALALVLNWAGSRDAMSGFKTAAILALLISISFDFGQYAWTNLGTLTLAFVDPIVGAIHSGIGGAVIGIMLGRGGEA